MEIIKRPTEMLNHRKSRLFAFLVDTLDTTIDFIPGTRRWSGHMWVDVVKPIS